MVAETPKEKTLVELAEEVVRHCMAQCLSESVDNLSAETHSVATAVGTYLQLKHAAQR